MDWILNKYERYNIHYNHFANKIIIESKIPVKVFIKLKKELESLNIKIKDIEVHNED